MQKAQTAGGRRRWRDVRRGSDGRMIVRQWRWIRSSVRSAGEMRWEESGRKKEGGGKSLLTGGGGERQDTPRAVRGFVCERLLLTSPLGLGWYLAAGERDRNQVGKVGRLKGNSFERQGKRESPGIAKPKPNQTKKRRATKLTMAGGKENGKRGVREGLSQRRETHLTAYDRLVWQAAPGTTIQLGDLLPF